jgi:predicted Fe-Mo cluster-binding NifX family protein
MNDTTVCIPLNADGTIHERLGQANTVAICRVCDGQITDWTEHVVAWDTTYGVDVLGVHHPRVIRFLQGNNVTAVVADNVCDVIQTTLPVLGIQVHDHITGDARTAAAGIAYAA